MNPRAHHTRGELCAMAALILAIVAVWVCADLAGGIERQF